MAQAKLELVCSQIKSNQNDDLCRAPGCTFSSATQIIQVCE